MSWYDLEYYANLLSLIGVLCNLNVLEAPVGTFEASVSAHSSGIHLQYSDCFVNNQASSITLTPIFRMSRLDDHRSVVIVVNQRTVLVTKTIPYGLESNI